ncbi:MAG: hypothetical protein RPR97_03260, partial [Colwellia sp.]
MIVSEINSYNPAVIKKTSGGVYLVLAVLASAFPLYSFYTVFKLALLGCSVVVILKNSDFKFVKDKVLLYFSLYLIFLMLNIRVLDEFSYKILFNQLVLLVAVVAVRYLYFNKKHFIFSLVLCFLFMLYAYIFNVNPVDGKPQVHAQIITFVFLSVVGFGMSSLRGMNALLSLVFLVKVRSVLLGFLPLWFYAVINRRVPYSLDRFSLFVLILFSLIFMLMLIYVDEIWLIFGSSFDSFSWRVIHWNNLLAEFNFNDFFFGKGLGYAWRETLLFDNFYSSGEQYIASHSNYVK